MQEDLATPQINIAYGTYYLRYLMDRYDQNEALAVAAYNAGHGNVDRWVRVGGRRRRVRRGPRTSASRRRAPT